MTKRFILYCIAFAVTFYIILHFKVAYTYSDFKDYAGSLLSVSGMVFTIMGIWIAFLYPNALNRLVNPSKISTADFSETMQETKRLEALVASILKSAFVVTSTTILFLCKVILSKTQIFTEHLLPLKSLALSVAIILTYIQLEAVANVMYANIMFINDIHKKREDRQADDDI